VLTAALPSSGIASSKTTVLGIRLDHERRAWVEATAARRGISVRALVEEMIDGSRVEEQAAESSAAEGTLVEPAEMDLEDRSLCQDLVGLATFPSRLVGAALSLGSSIVRRGSSCARRVVSPR
jgi:hypothetical protein